SGPERIVCMNASTTTAQNTAYLAGTHATYDPEADALYLTLGPPIPPGGVALTRVLHEVDAGSCGCGDIMADFDAQGHLLGIEILGVSMLPRPGSAQEEHA